ncbi:MAG: MBL fold metallo-hydrolase [Pseudobdellovibrionaceae bacterium]
MRIHHLNCGSMCPLGGRFWDGFSHGLSSHLVCHCLAIETNEGLVLVDTGFGTKDILYPEKRFSPYFRRLNRVQLEPERTALRQIQRLGFNQEDVRHIVLTHLDFDHAGGISDFPQAQVHVLKAELNAASQPQSWLDRNRFSPEQWGDVKKWQTYFSEGERWFGFESVRDLKGLPPEILLIPLVGHTWGHSGVAVQTDQGWLLHAGDAYFFREEMNPKNPYCTPGLRFYQTMMDQDRKSRLMNQRKLRQLLQTQGQQVHIFSAHDALELEFFQKAEKVESIHPRHPMILPNMDLPRPNL